MSHPLYRVKSLLDINLLTLHLRYLLCIFDIITCFTKQQYAGLTMFRLGYNLFVVVEFLVITHMSALCGLLGQVAPLLPVSVCFWTSLWP